MYAPQAAASIKGMNSCPQETIIKDLDRRKGSRDNQEVSVKKSLFL